MSRDDKSGEAGPPKALNILRAAASKLAGASNREVVGRRPRSVALPPGATAATGGAILRRPAAKELVAREGRSSSSEDPTEAGVEARGNVLGAGTAVDACGDSTFGGPCGIGNGSDLRLGSIVASASGNSAGVGSGADLPGGAAISWIKGSGVEIGGGEVFLRGRSAFDAGTGADGSGLCGRSLDATAGGGLGGAGLPFAFAFPFADRAAGVPGAEMSGASACSTNGGGFGGADLAFAFAFADTATGGAVLWRPRRRPDASL